MLIGDVSKVKSRWQVQLQSGVQTTKTKREALALAEEALVCQRLQEAVSEYGDRQARRTHPDGKTDKGGRWYPSATEAQPCCSDVMGPTRSFPWPYMLHCRTMRHIAHLYNVPAADLQKAGRTPPCREGGEHYYKAVAVADDGRLLSIYDGETEYQIGETLCQRPGQHHTGGYYVYASQTEARDAEVPPSSRLRSAQRVILRIRAEGSYCRYEEKLSFSRVTPLEVITGPDHTIGHTHTQKLSQ